MEKLKVYVNSFEIPTVGLVDKEGRVHACAKAQKIWAEGLEKFSGVLGSRYLSDEEKQALVQVESFCNNYDLEFEVIDLAKANLFTKLRWWTKRLQTPSIGYKEKIFRGTPTTEDIRQLVDE